MSNNILLAFILTIIAGFSTLLGLLIIKFKTNNKNLIVCCTMAFAAGVMISISIFDLIPESFNIIHNKYNDIIIIIIVYTFVMLGIIVSYYIERIIKKYNKNELYKIGIISMLAIIIHNIPEGIITFITTTKDTKLGLSIALGIILHNIPEGISIGVPIYYATKSKKKAFIYTFISAIAEPFGALITYIFLYKYINDTIISILFAFAAGLMIEISINELIPESIKYNKKKFIIYFIIGIVFIFIKYLL